MWSRKILRDIYITAALNILFIVKESQITSLYLAKNQSKPTFPVEYGRTACPDLTIRLDIYIESKYKLTGLPATPDTC
jgi:hypothetical protein